MLKHKVLFLLLIFGLTLTGCRGYRSESPPIHLNPNLDWQAKFKSQKFTAQYPDGTVAWGNERGFADPSSRENYLSAYSKSRSGTYTNGRPLSRIPIPVTKELLLKGQERFNIYCSVCHAYNGEGNGLVVQRGFPPAPDITSDTYKNKKDGYLFKVITDGIRKMPGYDKQLTDEEKWAIVGYLRALQRTEISQKQKSKKQGIK